MLRRSLLTAASSALRRNFAPQHASFSLATTTAFARSKPLEQLCQKQANRNFGNTHICCSSVAQELKEALQTEIKAEQQMEEENLGGKTAPAVPGFKIEKNGAEFILSKNHGSEKVMINVNINHSVDIEDDHFEDEEEAREHEMQNENPVPVSLPPFRVEIIKGNERLVFYLQMVKTERTDGDVYDYQVEEFMVAPAAKGDKYEEVPEDVYSSSGKYIDPQLHDLLFIRFLEERGIDSQFCHDLVKFATHYEHQQYVQLLEKLKKFIG